MLRISTIDSATEPKIVLHGKLIGPWIGELETIWDETCRNLGNRHLIVDLKDVTLIDDRADRLLAKMLKEGAELATSGVANRWLIETLKEGNTPVFVRALRPNTVGLSHTIDAERN